jgi:hypothetical protein
VQPATRHREDSHADNYTNRRDATPLQVLDGHAPW